jgi:hypothetical protein
MKSVVQVSSSDHKQHRCPQLQYFLQYADKDTYAAKVANSAAPFLIRGNTRKENAEGKPSLILL